MKTNIYEVSTPLKGTLYFQVEAKSAKEALEKVNDPLSELEPVDNSIERSGKGKRAIKIE